MKSSMDNLMKVAQLSVDTAASVGSKMASTEELNLTVAALKEHLDKVTALNQEKDRYFSSQLDSLAVMVNKMEQEYTKGLPEYFKEISLQSPSLSFSSPTLLCIKLKEEFERVENEYSQLRSQLSQESSTYLDANNQLSSKVRSLTHELTDITQKYQKLQQEKESIVQALQANEKGIFDAIRFKTVLEDNEKYKAQIEELKLQLINEKKVKINELFEEQSSLAKINSLTHGINILTNMKIELMNQLQTSETAHRLKETENQMKISYLEKENGLLVEKMGKMVHGVECLKRYMHDPESESNKKHLQLADLALNALSTDLANVKNEYISKSKIINQEITAKLQSLSQTVDRKTEEMLDIVGKSDQSYKTEIEHQKQEISKLVRTLDSQNKELTTAKASEAAMNQRQKEMQLKLDTMESAIDTNRGFFFDNNLDLSASMDIDRVTKALKKSLEMIAYLQNKIDSLTKKSG